MMKAQPMKELIAQMRAVARGATKAPADAAERRAESVEARTDLRQDLGAKSRC